MNKEGRLTNTTPLPLNKSLELYDVHATSARHVAEHNIIWRERLISQWMNDLRYLTPESSPKIYVHTKLPHEKVNADVETAYMDSAADFR